MLYQNILSKTKQKTRLKVIFWQRDLPILVSVLIAKGRREKKLGIIPLHWPYGLNFIWIGLDRNFQRQRLIGFPAFKSCQTRIYFGPKAKIMKWKIPSRYNLSFVPYILYLEFGNSCLMWQRYRLRSLEPFYFSSKTFNVVVLNLEWFCSLQGHLTMSGDIFGLSQNGVDGDGMWVLVCVVSRFFLVGREQTLVKSYSA